MNNTKMANLGTTAKKNVELDGEPS